MPLFSCFCPFGQLEFSNEPSLCEKIYQQIVNDLGGAYDLTVGGHNEATIYARARAIATAMQSQRRAGNNALPLKCVELLPLQEEGYGLVPSETDTIAQRQTNLAARMQLSRGATRENIETQLRAIFGADFIAYRTLVGAEIVTSPASPDLGPGVFTRIDSTLIPKYVKLLDPVPVIGPRTVYYTAWDSSQVFQPLSKNDVMTVQIECLALAEKVTVSAAGSDSSGNWFTATFAKAHDIGASAIVGNVPIWISTQRYALIVVAAASAVDATKRAKADELMERISRGVSEWAIVEPLIPGGSTVGPFKLGLAPIGATTIGQVGI